MNSDQAQIEILKDELNETRAIVDFVRGELWARAQAIWEATDCLYYALVLLGSCDSCKGESVSWMKSRFQESKRVGELVAALKVRDMKNAQLLGDVGIDLDTWVPSDKGKQKFKLKRQT